MKRKITAVLVVLMFLSFTISSVAAFIPPGLAKKGGLPPGIQKKISDEDWKYIIEEWENQFGEWREGFGKEMIDREYDTVLEKIDVNTKRITIKEGTAYLNLLVGDSAQIKLDGKSAELKDLSVGDKVYLKLGKDNTVTEIIATKVGETKGESKTLKGANVESISYETRRITLNHNNTRTRYDVNDDATITINGSTRSLNYIKEDMKVDVTIKDGKISKITVVNRIEKYEGKLINKYTNDDDDIYIFIEIDGIPEFFYIDEDLYISTKLIGKNVTIEVEDEIVVDIWEK